MKRVLLFAFLCLWACAAPDPESDLFNRGEALYVRNEAEAQALEQRVVKAIDGAELRVWASFERLESRPVAAALLRAVARGLDVRVLSDIDRARDAGLVDLKEKLGKLEDGKPRLVMLGGALDYSPEPNRDLGRGSDLNRITDSFLLIDTDRVINLSEGFGPGDALRWGFDVSSTDLAKDFADEHGQLFSGVSATTLSYYDGILKSNNNDRVYYPMPDSVWELYFGPQERLMKRVIDEVYAARASVQIITPELSNTFLVDALRYKARVGGIVDLLVARDSLDRSSSRFRELSKAIADDKTSAQLRVAEKLGFTVVVIDAERARDGRRYQTRVLVISHALVESIPFDAADVSRPSDAFMDGNMWVWSRPSAGESASVERALAEFDRIFSKGTAP